MTRVRLPVSFFLSSILTVTLFWFLGWLIATDPSGVTIPVVPRIDFTRLVPDTPEATIIRIPPPKKPVLTHLPAVVIDQPNVVRPTIDRTGLTPEGAFGPGGLTAPPGRGTEITHVGGSDRGPVPQVRLEPDYPPQLRDRGIEGWITFRFTVTKTGRVKDIEIVDSQPARVWDRATIRAVSSWQYQPALQDGAPVEQVGVMATYRFELER